MRAGIMVRMADGTIRYESIQCEDKKGNFESLAISLHHIAANSADGMAMFFHDGAHHTHSVYTDKNQTGGVQALITSSD